MIHHKPPFEIPIDELTFITPDSREKLFRNLIDNYKVFYPSMTLVYAFLNKNSALPVDYALVFDGPRQAIAKPVQLGAKYESAPKDSYMWVTPYIYSWSSIPGYRYCVRENKHAEFFTEQRNLFCRLPKSHFDEFIVDVCELSNNPNTETYWKNPIVAEDFATHLSEMYLRNKQVT